MRDDTDLQQRILESQAENQRLTALVENLKQHLQQSLDSIKKFEVVLADLQGKLDILILHTKKRNKRDYCKKTEKHNPRPVLDKRMYRSSAASAPEKSTGIKRILRYAINVSH